MLYSFLIDMWDILRLRYKNPADYFYTLPVILAILLLLGMINAADMSTLLDVSTAVFVFAVMVTVIKWLILSRVMRYVLSRNGELRSPLWGFILASEALMIPTLLVFYIGISPKSMNSIKGITEKGALPQYWVGTKKVTRLMK